MAEVLKRDAIGISEDNVSDAEYQSAKIDRNQEQAQRSMKAEAKADNKSISDKLNLDEIVPPAVEDALDLD